MSKTHIQTFEHEFKLGESSFTGNSEGKGIQFVTPPFPVSSIVIRQLAYQDTANIVGPIAVDLTIGKQNYGTVAIVTVNSLTDNKSVATISSPNTRITYSQSMKPSSITFTFRQRGEPLTTITGQFACVLEFISAKEPKAKK